MPHKPLVLTSSAEYGSSAANSAYTIGHASAMTSTLNSNHPVIRIGMLFISRPATKFYVTYLTLPHF